MPLLQKDPRRLDLKVPTWYFPPAPGETCVPGFEKACEHYPLSDFPLFYQGYHELCREDLSDKVAVELACGKGDLAVCLAARFPKARIIAVDRYPEAGSAIREAHARGEVPNLEYHCGDAFDLGFLGVGSVHLVYGQAALHHLASDAQGIARQAAGVLAPGGRLVFLFEPLGHNWLVSCVRAIQIARHQMCDESNLFDSVFRLMLCSFSKAEVQSFNLSGYFLKAVPRRFAVAASRIANRIDRWLAGFWRNAPLHGANGNIIFFR